MAKKITKTYSVQMTVHAMYEVEVQAENFEDARRAGEDEFHEQIKGLCLVDGKTEITGITNMTDGWGSINND